MQELTIVKEDVQKQDLSYFTEAGQEDWLVTRPSGVEHYRLLTYMAHQFQKSTIIDAGTYRGWSALALAQNSTNTIKSYDINYWHIPFLKQYENVQLIVKDVNAEDKEVLLNSPLILLDVDPHDGEQERVFTQRLEEIGYTGFVLCDDIFLNPSMEQWWSKITRPKFDLTDVGHSHGTGLICYNTKAVIV